MTNPYTSPPVEPTENQKPFSFWREFRHATILLWLVVTCAHGNFCILKERGFIVKKETRHEFWFEEDVRRWIYGAK